MMFSVNPEIFERFPGLNIGLVVTKGIDNRGESAEVTALLREIEKEIREKYETGTLSQQPRIAAWREAYSSFGAKPKKYRCSVENLHRMVLDDIELKHINKVVDIYNYISLRHMVPVGGDDTGKVEGDIELKFAKGDEKFIELNSEETKSPKEGEVIYTDSKEVLCRRWNWRECDKTKMTEGTTNVAIVVEGLPPLEENDVRKIIKELSEMIQKYCGGSVETHVVNSRNPTINLD